MNAPPSTLRLALSAPVAALALVAGFHGVPAFVPPGEILAALKIWPAVALLLAWLLVPAPWGGGASLDALLTPDAARPRWIGFAVVLPLALAAAIMASAMVSVATMFDRNGLEPRDATPGELAERFALALGLASFHSLYILGWVLGQQMRAQRHSLGCLLACVLTIAYQTLIFAFAGRPAFGFAVSVVVFCPLTLLIAVPVLLGGRVWPAILAAATGATLPLLLYGVRDYPM